MAGSFWSRGKRAGTSFALSENKYFVSPWWPMQQRGKETNRVKEKRKGMILYQRSVPRLRVPLDFGGRRRAAIRRCRSSRQRPKSGKMREEYFYIYFYFFHLFSYNDRHSKRFIPPSRLIWIHRTPNRPSHDFFRAKIQISICPPPARLWWAFNDCQRA